MAILILLVVTLSGCTLGFVGPETSGDIGELMRWVDENVEATPDYTGEYWQSPQETLERGKGDCEDHAVLLLWLFYEATGNKADLVAITRGYGSPHAVVEWDGVWYDSTWSAEILPGGRLTETWRISYDLAMLRATRVWTKRFDRPGDV